MSFSSLQIALLAALVAVAHGGVAYGGYGAPALAYGHAPVAVAKAVAIEAPQPYEFGYSHHTDDGAASSRQESSDANNAKHGSYSIQNPDGTYRHVEYVADAAGFRAVVKTNEHGTAPQNPAATQILAEEPPYKVLPAPAPVVKTVATPLIAKAAIASPAYAAYGGAYGGLGLRSAIAAPGIAYGGLGLRSAIAAPGIAYGGLGLRSAIAAPGLSYGGLGLRSAIAAPGIAYGGLGLRTAYSAPAYGGLGLRAAGPAYGGLIHG